MAADTIKTTNYSDEILIEKYKNGDKNAMAELYSRYYKKVYSKCYSFTGNHDDAFDLSQDILLKTFDKIGSFKGESKFSTWLYAITQNHCIENKRKEKNLFSDDLFMAFQIADDFNTEHETDIHEIEKQRKLKYLDMIPNTDKEFLLLKYKFNLSIKELQKRYNLSESAVKMRLLRAKDKVEKINYLNTPKISIAI
ncbi:MAG: RNA polymerase sigma factor [Bacteroidales bacterium]|nr:RNA polymerase sigma factor [Bacteroidales bacterium]